MNKLVIVTLGLTFSLASLAQDSCTFTTKQIETHNAFCKIKADKVKAVYVEVCGTSTCTDSSGETSTCTTCSDEFSHYEKIGEYELDAEVRGLNLITDDSRIKMTYTKDNSLSVTIENQGDILHGLITDKLIIKNDNYKQSVSGYFEIESKKLKSDYELLNNSFTVLKYDRLNKELILNMNHKTDLKQISLVLFYSRKAISQQQGGNWYWDNIYYREIKPSDLFLKEDGNGSIYATLNLKKQTELSHFRFKERRRYAMLNISNKLPQMANPIQPEKYIKSKRLEVKLISKE